MLIAFHYIAILIQQLLRKRRRLKPSISDSDEIDGEDIEHLFKFDPPVFRQRYAKIYEYLLDERWRNNLKKLVDFGCAEYGLFLYIKPLNIEEVLFVDIDEQVLTEKIGIIEPLLMEKLRKRSTKLEAFVYRGSMVDPDYRLRKSDVVTAVEVVEHLYPDTLEALPYNIFSFIRPKLVFFTTPNADFNVVFKRDGFRHPDHKFEWTRNQFEDWCSNLTQRFPDYTVQYFGVGELQSQPPNIGPCSQGALFIRKDLLEEKYISPNYARSCQCDNSSPCKGQTTICKMQCNCICAFCLPDFSVGICRYLSCNVDDLAYRPMTRNKSLSDTCLEVAHDYMSFVEEIEQPDVNPAYNIYYKLLQRVEYPFEEDERTEEERIGQLLKYRSRAYGSINSRFYVEERERCEIPIRDLMYDVHVSADEVRRILSQEGIEIELCQIPETGTCEYCVISVPHEMEEQTSSEISNASSGKTEASELLEAEGNIDSLSDWDANQDAQPSEQGPTTSLDPPKPLNPDPLFDSGYIKSPSPLDANPQLPQLPLEDPDEQETDFFDENSPTPKLNSQDNRLHLKKSVARERQIALYSSWSESIKTKRDPNKVNEFDTFNNRSNPQNEFRRVKPLDIPCAGPSTNWKRPRRGKDKERRLPPPPPRKKPTEPTSMDDAKSLTNCIIENSLNRIEEDMAGPSSPYIKDHLPLIIAEVEHEEQGLEVDAAPVGMENGDLANNNRDNEGNNLEEHLIEDQDIDEGIDLINDNLEDGAPNNINNNEPENEPQGPNEPEAVNLDEGDNLVPNPSLSSFGKDESTALAHASTEVLFDQNSQIDLLDDFDIPQMPSNSALEIVSGSVELESSLPTSDLSTNTSETGAHVVISQDEGGAFDHDDPNLYCQGDGLGVHPSVIAIEVEEDPDADNDSDDSSIHGSQTDYAYAGHSSLYSLSRLPINSAELLLMQEQSLTDISGSLHEEVVEISYDDPLLRTLMESTLVVDQIIKNAEAVVAYRTRTDTREAGQSTSSESPHHIPDDSSFLLNDLELEDVTDIVTPIASNSIMTDNSQPLQSIVSSLSQSTDVTETMATAQQGELSDAEKSEYFDTLDKSIYP